MHLKIISFSTNQSEGSENGETFDAGESELDEAEDDDDNVEAAPLVLKVFVESQCQNLQSGLNGEDAGEHL